MALPPQQLPPHGPQAPLVLQLLPNSVLPKGFYTQGSANLCQLPSQEQPFPASWISWTAGAPPAPQAPPAGLQRAPCGCFFNPHLFSMQWTLPNPPPVDTSTLGFSAAAQPGAALLGPGGYGSLPLWAAPGTSQNHQGTGPAGPVPPEPSAGNQHIEGVPAGNNISSTDTAMGIAHGDNIPTGSNVLLDPSSNHQNPGLGEPDGDIEVTEEMLLREALRLFGMSKEMEAVIQHGSSSVTMPEDRGDTIGKGRTLTPAAPDLLNSMTSNKNIEGVSAQPNIPSTDTSVGTALGVNIPPGNDVPPSPSCDPHHQGFGDLKDSLAQYKEVPLEEALRFFSCYEDSEKVIQDGPSSSRMPGDPVGTDTGIPLYDFTSLSLPDELLTCDYDINEIAKVIQSPEDIINTGMYPHDFWADVGMDLEPSQPDGAEQWGTK